MVDAHDDPWPAAVRRFADWLADNSPYYRELRTEVAVHDGAPLRLRQLWETLGWAPGVGYGGRHAAMRPERHVTRKLAERAFKRWVSDQRFVAATGLATPADVWRRLPEQPWILYVRAKATGGRFGGSVSYVDESAGDDPVTLRWTTEDPPYEPTAGVGSAATNLLVMTARWQFITRSAQVQLDSPGEPGPLAPALSGWWELAPGVWGLAAPEQPARLDRIVFRRPVDYSTFALCDRGGVRRVGVILVWMW